MNVHGKVSNFLLIQNGRVCQGKCDISCYLHNFLLSLTEGADMYTHFYQRNSSILERRIDHYLPGTFINPAADLLCRILLVSIRSLYNATFAFILYDELFLFVSHILWWNLPCLRNVIFIATQSSLAFYLKHKVEDDLLHFYSLHYNISCILKFLASRLLKRLISRQVINHLRRPDSNVVQLSAMLRNRKTSCRDAVLLRFWHVLTYTHIFIGRYCLG